jgi:hypothetical protein
MLEVTITDEQKVPVTLTPLTAAGHPATVDGIPVWTVKTGDATVVTGADGLSAVLVSGTDGDSEIGIAADADLGAGIETISATILLHVMAPKAANLGLTAGAPELK